MSKPEVDPTVTYCGELLAGELRLSLYCILRMH